MSDSMPFETQMQSRAPAVPSRSYVMAWITVAMLAVGYVSVLAARPEFLSAYLPEARGDAAGADVATMRSTIQQLNSELAEAKTAAATSAAQVGALNSRIAELEGRLAAGKPAPTTPVAAAPAAVAPVAAAVPPVAAAPAEAPASALARKFAEAKAAAPEPVKPQVVAPVVAPVVAQVVAKAAVPPAPATAATDAAAAIETGSIALPKSAAAAPAAAVAAPVAFGTATVTPAPQPFGLQIGRGGSIDELRLSWNLLQETHAASLRSLSPHYAAASDAADAPLNLLAGPIKSKAEAIKVCKTLSAQGVACKVGAFAGEPL
jgi:uncharacterized coiled-coil protein SlyX